MRVAGLFIIQNKRDSRRQPTGLEDDDILQGFVVGVVDEMPEAVFEGQEELGFGGVHALLGAEIEDLLAREVGGGVIFEYVAHFLPTFGHGAPNFGELGGGAGNGILEGDDAVALTVGVGFGIDEEEIAQSLLAEKIPEFLAVDIGLAGAGTAVGSDDENFGIGFAVFDEPDPLLDEALLGTFARFPDDEVNGGGGEEKLVGWAIDALPAEIPAVEGQGGAASRVSGLNFANVDAVRSGVFLPIFALEGVHEAGFADFAFADEDEFGFVEGSLWTNFKTSICY